MTIATDAATGAPLLRTSERSDFKRCPWYWHQHWNRGLTSRRVPTWAWFGSAIHAALEVRYPNGKKRAPMSDMIDAFVEACNNETRRIYTESNGKAEIDDTEIVDGIALGKAMLRGYVEEYGEDSEWEVLHTEQPFQINVPDPRDPDRILVVYAGTWDALWRNRRTGEYWIVDHKTRKTFPHNWSFYNINDQAGSYLWVVPEVLEALDPAWKGLVVEGLIFNALKKAMPDKRPRNSDGLCTNKPKKEHYVEALQRKDIHIPPKATLATLEEIATEFRVKVLGDVSAVQPGPLFHREEIWRSPQERVSQARRVQAEAMVMEGMRNGSLPLYKTPTEDCVRCPLFEFCELHEQNPDEGEELAAGTLVTRDPYAAHRSDMKLKGGVEI